jgi:L-aminopeptidase/D-esterase-like protein
VSDNDAPTMADICRVLEDTFTHDGVARWLASAHYRLSGDSAIFRCSTAKGRREVYALADNLRGMIAT